MITTDVIAAHVRDLRAEVDRAGRTERHALRDAVRRVLRRDTR